MKYCVVHYDKTDNEVTTCISVFGPFDDKDQASRCACDLIPFDYNELPLKVDACRRKVHGVEYDFIWRIGGNLAILERHSDQYWLVQQMLV